jgi:uncharacterized membrane protein YedE/YeeE
MCEPYYETIFTPVESTLGGVLLGSACAAMLLMNGRITGMSGILNGLITHQADWPWRALFFISLIVGGIVAQLINNDTFVPSLEGYSSPWVLATAGLLVGFGATLGTGCTSGHAICGVSRFSKRSIFGTANMMFFAAVVVYMHRHVVCVDSKYATLFPGMSPLENDIQMNTVIGGVVLLIVSNIILFFEYRAHLKSKDAKAAKKDSHLVVALSGLQFGAGLAISGMVNMYKVRGFLDVFGYWDPSLAFVILGAYIITMPSFYFILKRSAPVICPKFQFPNRKEITWQLAVGTLVFGLGWGLVGICPGPGVVSFSRIFFQSPDILVLLFFLIIGMYLNKGLETHLTARAAAAKAGEKASLTSNISVAAPTLNGPATAVAQP